MNTLTVILLIWTLICSWAIAVLGGCMVGMQTGCKIWAPEDSYEELYGPKGTQRPGFMQRFLFKLLGP